MELKPLEKLIKVLRDGGVLEYREGDLHLRFDADFVPSDGEDFEIPVLG